MSGTLKSTIAAKVAAERKAAHLSQAELGARIERTAEAISNIERAKSLPALDTLVAISEALDVSLKDFFPDQEHGDVAAHRARIEAEIVSLLRGMSDDRAKIALSQIKALAQA